MPLDMSDAHVEMQLSLALSLSHAKDMYLSQPRSNFFLHAVKRYDMRSVAVYSAIQLDQ